MPTLSRSAQMMKVRNVYMSPVRLTPVRRDNAHTAFPQTVFTTVKVLFCEEMVETKNNMKRPAIMRSHDTV